MKFSLVVLTFLAVAAAQEEDVAEDVAEVEAEAVEVVVPVQSVVQSAEIVNGVEAKVAGLNWYTLNNGTLSMPEEWIYWECSGEAVTLDKKGAGFTCGVSVNDGTTLDSCSLSLTLSKKGKYDSWNAVGTDSYGAPSTEGDVTTFAITGTDTVSNCEAVEEEGWNQISYDATSKKYTPTMKWRKMINTGDSEDIAIAVGGQDAAKAADDEEQTKYSVVANFSHDGTSSKAETVFEGQVFLSGAMQVAVSMIASAAVVASIV